MGGQLKWGLPSVPRFYHGGKVVRALRASTTRGLQHPLPAALCLAVSTGREIGLNQRTRQGAGKRMKNDFAFENEYL